MAVDGPNIPFPTTVYMYDQTPRANNEEIEPISTGFSPDFFHHQRCSVSEFDFRNNFKTLVHVVHPARETMTPYAYA